MALRRSVRLAALFSGGKDSTYAAYVAVQRGWELTHLLSVIPEDRDSMLFHVPNLSMTALLAQAMERPLLTEVAKAGEAGELDALRRIFRRIDVDGVVVGASAANTRRWSSTRRCSTNGSKCSGRRRNGKGRPESGASSRRACSRRTGSLPSPRPAHGPKVPDELEPLLLVRDLRPRSLREFQARLPQPPL